MTNTNAKDLHKGLREAGTNLLHFENHKNQKKRRKKQMLLDGGHVTEGKKLTMARPL